MDVLLKNMCKYSQLHLGRMIVIDLVQMWIFYSIAEATQHRPCINSDLNMVDNKIHFFIQCPTCNDKNGGI